MSSLITGFDMEIDEVIRLQSFQSGSYFILVICIIQSGCPLHCDATQAGIISDSVNQVNSRDNSSFLYLRESFGESGHLRTIAGAPRPDTIGRIFAFGNPLQI